MNYIISLLFLSIYNFFSLRVKEFESHFALIVRISPGEGSKTHRIVIVKRNFRIYSAPNIDAVIIILSSK